MTEAEVREIVRQEVSSKLRVYLKFKDFDNSQGYMQRNILYASLLYGDRYESEILNESDCHIHIYE